MALRTATFCAAAAMVAVLAHRAPALATPADSAPPGATAQGSTPSAPLPLSGASTQAEDDDLTPDAIGWPTRIDAIDIVGVSRTRPRVVLRELPFRAGTLVSRTDFELGVVRLWNIGLFSKVSASLRDRAGRRHLVLRLEERWTLNPLFSFQVLVKRGAEAGQESTWWSLGASDINLLGRFLEVGARYERFNAFSGGQFYLRDWRLFDERIDALLLVESLVRPRVGFADRRLLTRLDVNRQLGGDRLRVGARLELQVDRFFDAGDTPPALPAASETLQLDAGVRFGRIDTDRIRQSGASVELRPTLAMSRVRGHDLWPQARAFVQGLWFWAPGQRLNLALRLQGAVQSKSPEHLQFFVGGLYEVRGVRDSYLRGDRYALINAELRLTAYDAMWLAVVPTGFVDVAWAHGVAPDAAGVLPAKASAALLASAGAGVRLLVPRLVRTGLRLDVAVPVHGIECRGPRLAGVCPGLSVGVFQYF